MVLRRTTVQAAVRRTSIVFFLTYSAGTDARYSNGPVFSLSSLSHSFPSIPDTTQSVKTLKQSIEPKERMIPIRATKRVSEQLSAGEIGL